MTWNDFLKNTYRTAGIKVPAINSLYDLLVVLANIAIIVGVGIALVSIAMSFFNMIMSTGDPKAFDKARLGVFWGGIALVACILAYVFKGIFIGILGAKGVL